MIYLYFFDELLDLIKQTVATPISEGCVTPAGCSYHKSKAWSGFPYLLGQEKLQITYECSPAGWRICLPSQHCQACGDAF